MVSGTIGHATVKAGGPSKTYMRTVNGSVNVNLDEKAILYIGATAGTLPAFCYNPSPVVDRCCMIPATIQWLVSEDTRLYLFARVVLFQPASCNIRTCQGHLKLTAGLTRAEIPASKPGSSNQVLHHMMIAGSACMATCRVTKNLWGNSWWPPILCRIARAT